ncbi:pentapeptide repeat-containing protein [Neorhizobium alkalisoli]|uniref:Uncharacterized protein YjbI with pentapeptide repeats n=1 Tax=Neorhizobium alkalisoli TaxID=528178 RepID=A0A561QHN3_9HYPH|nr:pentapeptide repeat-containing protein [Neorhizobium alkalisoli]TWF49851.1 uncharacterized protein YjbI with pentapeptide repeats [Neorhizobium alkalisoli]
MAKGFLDVALGVGLAVAIALVGLLPKSLVAQECRSEPAPGINWGGCGKRNLMLSGSDFTNASLAEADLSFTDLRDSIFKGADLEKAKLARAWLAGVQAEKANFSKIEGYRADFQKMQAKGATFAGAELQRANFSGADLEGVSFEKAELSRVNFDKATLTKSRFSYTNLARADFTDAIFDGPLDFSSSFLFLTKIQGVDLSKATGLDQHQINMACGDAKTKLPPGLSAPYSWPCGDTD